MRSEWLDQHLKVPILIRRHLAALNLLNLLPSRANPYYDRPPPSPHPIPPLATEPHLVAAADPGKSLNLRDSPGLQEVKTPVKVPAFVKAHVDTCQHCLAAAGCLRGQLSRPAAVLEHQVSETCYARQLFDYLRFGYWPPIHTWPDPSPSESLRRRPQQHVFSASAREAWKKQRDMPHVFEEACRNDNFTNLVVATRRSFSTGLSKSRICWDGRRVNEGLEKWPIRYADLRHVLRSLNEGDWVATVDIRSFYLQLPVHPAARHLLAVRDPFTGEHIRYKVLPFGLSTAPAFASLVSAEIVRILKERLIQRGVTNPRVLAYLDDFTLISSSRVEANLMCEELLALLAEIGLGAAHEKTTWASQRPKILGAFVDTRECTVSALPGHVEEAQARVALLLGKARWRRRALYQAVGILNWLSVFIPSSVPRMRGLWNEFRRVRSRPTARPLRKARADLAWWAQRLRCFPTCVSWAPLEVVNVQSDASGTGGFGVVWGSRLFAQRWRPDQLEHSIPWKELFPVVAFARRFKTSLQGKILLWGTDSATNTFSINAGHSAAGACHRLLLELADLAEAHQFVVAALWLPREHNELADALSKGEIPAELLVPLPEYNGARGRRQFQ
jgi:hypothetical protein